MIRESLREKRPLAQNSATQKFLSWWKVKGLLSLCKGISLVKGKIDMHKVRGQGADTCRLDIDVVTEEGIPKDSAVNEDASGKALPDGEVFSMDASGFSNIRVINSQR